MQNKNQFTSEEVVDLIQSLGWRLVNAKGCHQHFSHATTKGLLTIPHPAKGYLPIALTDKILNYAGGKN